MRKSGEKDTQRQREDHRLVPEIWRSSHLTEYVERIRTGESECDRKASCRGFVSERNYVHKAFEPQFYIHLEKQNRNAYKAGLPFWKEGN